MALFAATVHGGLCAAGTLASAPLPEVSRSLAVLGSPGAAGDIHHIDGVTLEAGRTVSFDLEAFDVWDRNVKIVEFSAEGPRILTPPSDRYYRGAITNEPGSLVFLAVGRTVRGLVFSGEDVWAIAPDENAYVASGGQPGSLVRRIDPERDLPAGRAAFHCGAESLTLPSPVGALPDSTRAPTAPLYTSTQYTATIALETDYELYWKLGSSSALTTYVGDLVAASSAIYQRDIQVRKVVGVLHIYSTSSDPWTQTSPDLALYELGDYWHSHYPGVARSTVHLLSGKNGGGGIAWLGTVCRADMLCSGNCGSPAADGHYAGGYGVSSSLAGEFSTTNPSLYWDLLCFSHEVGHNFNSPHTQCYVPPVDTCCPCGAGACTGSVPPEKGTIMSYCHLLSGGYSNIKLFLAVPTESSLAVYNVMRTFVETQASCLSTTSLPPTLTSISPNFGDIAGGTAVSITGTNFVSGATVSLGGAAATSVNVVNASLITAVSSAHIAGTVNVVVTNPGPQAVTLTNSFTYIVPTDPPGLPPAVRFYTLPPCRVADTRNAAGALGGPSLPASSTRLFPVALSTCGVPSNAKAVSANLTVTGTAAAGSILVYPASLAAAPVANSLSFKAGQTRANNAILNLGWDGSGAVKVLNSSAGATDFIIDVNGYFR